MTENLNGWRKVRLGDVCDITMGTSPKGTTFNTDGIGIAFFQGSAEFSYSSPIVKKYTTDPKRYAEIGDILFSVRAPVGDMNIADIKCAIGRGLCAIRSKNDSDQNFIKYYLKHTKHLWSAINDSGTIFGCVTKKDLESFIVKLPPIAEQKRISAVLSALDDKIANNHKMNETLENMAQAMFKAWFTDFTPTKELIKYEQGTSAYKTKNEIAHALYMPPETLDHFPNELDNNGLPMGWKMQDIGTLVTRLKAKKRYKKNDVVEYGNIPVYEQGNQILLGFHNEQPDFNASNKNMMFVFGDHTCITKLSNIPFSISQNVIALKGNKYPTPWVYYAVQNKQEFQEYRRHWAEFIVKKVVVPSMELTEYFAEQIKLLQSQKTQNNLETQTLTEIRKTLLPKLISGEIRV